jgi:Inner membrane component of T3SS, cytoplasmic domain
MKAPFFVEVLHRNKEVRHRQQLHGLPIRIGRGYDNDIILDDPHTSAHHAIIDQTADNDLLLQDLDSQNGIIHKGRRQKELLLDGNTVFRLGHTNLRVRCADFPVADEIAASTFYNWEGWPPAVAGIALIIGLTVATTWLEDTEKFELIRYLIAVAVALGLGMAWCGLWSFANRLFGGNARLGRHLFILGCGFAALQTWSLLSGTIAYAFSCELFTRYGSHVEIAIIAAMIFHHLLHIKPYRSRLFIVTSVTLALLGSGFMLMINYNSSGRLADELYMHERLPPAVRLSADKPLSRFLGDAAGLKARVDEERTKAVNGDEADSNDQD